MPARLDVGNGPSYDAVVKAPFAVLGIRTQDGALTGIDFLPKGTEERPARNAVAANVVKQLRAYLDTPEFAFDLPLSMTGTAFQKKVWKAMGTIPRGGSVTYGELAKQLHSSARAVGGACRENPIPIVVPCHRVIGATGLGGYAGDTAGGKLNIKAWLLRHEGVV